MGFLCDWLGTKFEIHPGYNNGQANVHIEIFNIMVSLLIALQLLPKR